MLRKIALKDQATFCFGEVVILRERQWRNT